MKKFYVTCKETCQECEGEGRIASPPWIDFQRKSVMTEPEKIGSITEDKFSAGRRFGQR